MCDLRLCYGDREPWKLKEYFSVVIDNSRKAGGNEPSGMRLNSGADALNRRIGRMIKYKKQKDFKPVAALLVALCFILTSSLTSLAAGIGVEALYNVACNATEVMKTDTLSTADDLEEYTWSLSSEQTVSYTGDQVSFDTRGLKSYTWELPGGATYLTALFYASKGDTVSLSVTPSPQTAETSAGIQQPNGVMRGVSAEGPYGHTFTISQTGFHRVYVENRENTTVTVILAVSR